MYVNGDSGSAALYCTWLGSFPFLGMLSIGIVMVRAAERLVPLLVPVVLDFVLVVFEVMLATVV